MPKSNDERASLVSAYIELSRLMRKLHGTPGVGLTQRSIGTARILLDSLRRTRPNDNEVKLLASVKVIDQDIVRQILNFSYQFLDMAEVIIP